MATLAEVAQVVKSANAGASWLTFDIECGDRTAFERVLSSGSLTTAVLGPRLGVSPADVRIFVIDSLNCVKITVPRRVPTCGQDERDFDGVQQYVPLLDLDVP